MNIKSSYPGMGRLHYKYKVGEKAHRGVLREGSAFLEKGKSEDRQHKNKPLSSLTSVTEL